MYKVLKKGGKDDPRYPVTHYAVWDEATGAVAERFYDQAEAEKLRDALNSGAEAEYDFNPSDPS